MGSAIDRVLIANRGEVAVRVIRACRELGIEAVAVHLPGEAGDLHVQLADAGAEIPSFLDPDAILGAAEALAADAVHPGYGYLAESPDFAERVLGCRASRGSARPRWRCAPAGTSWPRGGWPRRRECRWFPGMGGST